MSLPQISPEDQATLYSLADKIRSQILAQRPPPGKSTRYKPSSPGNNVSLKEASLWELVTILDSARLRTSGSSSSSLISLPTELLHHVASYLSPTDLRSFLVVNKELNSAITPHLYRVQAKVKGPSKVLYKVLTHSNGELSTIENLLGAGIDVFAKIKLRYEHSLITPLSVAAEQCHEVIVRYFLENGAKFHSPNKKEKKRPIWDGDSGGSCEDQDRDEEDPRRQKMDSVTDALLSCLRMKVSRLRGCGSGHRLHYSKGKKGCVITTLKTLLEFKADVKIKDEDFWGDSALHYAAAATGKLIDGVQGEIMRMLLEHGADVKAINSTKETPLHMASTAEAVDILMSVGAELEVLDERGLTPLGAAAAHGNLEVVAALVERYGANVTHASPKDSLTVLMAAVSDSRYDNTPRADVVHYLLEHGAKLSKDNTSRTPLIHAVKKDYPFMFRDVDMDIVDALLEAGEDINSVDGSGCTALDHVSTKESESYMRREWLETFLQQRGAKLGSEVESVRDRRVRERGVKRKRREDEQKWRIHYAEYVARRNAQLQNAAQ